jgi:ribonuclease HI
MTMNSITIFTDGSSRGNPGPGGWGALIVTEGETPHQTHVTELGGGEKKTTNNRMELMAALEALRRVGLHHKGDVLSITVNTDSSYLINGITKWVHGWKKNGWLTKTKEDVVNKDIWSGLLDATHGKKISWKYVGGHIGILGNERCDHIATAFADGRALNLYDGPLAAYDLPDVMDLSEVTEKAASKKSSSSHSKAKAYSYVSSVGGVIAVHHSWPECEKRVKGAKGARYKKALSALDEAAIMGEFKS